MIKNILFLTFLFSLTSLLALPSEPLVESAHCEWIQDYLIQIPNFPKKGLHFQWYSNLLGDPKAFKQVIQLWVERYKNSNLDVIVGIDSRGYIFGAVLAYELDLPFVMIRKTGKLPRKVERVTYDLEYSKNIFEIEVDSLKMRDRVLIVDDIIATGNSTKAACELVERLGAKVVEVACLVEIKHLKGRQNLNAPLFSLLAIEGN